MPPCLPKAELYRRAAEITDTWAVFVAAGQRDGRWKHVKATSEKEALRKGGKNATVARPWLPTSQWVELPPVCAPNRRRL